MLPSWLHKLILLSSDVVGLVGEDCITVFGIFSQVDFLSEIEQASSPIQMEVNRDFSGLGLFPGLIVMLSYP